MDTEGGTVAAGAEAEDTSVGVQEATDLIIQQNRHHLLILLKSRMKIENKC